MRKPTITASRLLSAEALTLPHEIVLRKTRSSGSLKEHEAGVSVADPCRKHGVSDASIYKWKAKFGGMDVSEAKRLRTLEDENTKLKRLLAEAMLDNTALKDLLGKKW